MTSNITNTHLREGSIQVEFIWFGVAVSAPRMTRSDKWNQRPCVMEYRAFKDSLRLEAAQAGYTSDYTVATLSASIYLPIPASLSAKSAKELVNQPHRKKPDVDNMAKSILDALAINDQSCWSLGIEKRYDDGNGSRIELSIKANLIAKPTTRNYAIKPTCTKPRPKARKATYNFGS